MQVFFSSLFELESFSHRLKSIPQSNACQFCLKNCEWVSHGYVYKQLNYQFRAIVGKRILCSNRGSHLGCGRTRQLYLDVVLPHKHYPLQTLLAFVIALFDGLPISKAWHGAVGHHRTEPRQAWRWLNSLMSKLANIRSLLQRTCQPCSPFNSRRLALLLPTLQALFASQPHLQRIQSRLQMSLLA
ncbi:hypothetical protein [Aliikangiella sp. IMCC44359]|uniref:hypothetical protein n=1 Tax=Aliikangiella sp. IMCC44359 TaxID=3459125 RepID=UPI00403AEE8C